MNTMTKNKLFSSKELSICPSSGQLTSRSHAVRLGPVNMRVLVVLLQHSGQVVSREQIFESVWPNQVVSDDTLTRCISDLRSQLKIFDHENTTKYIETVPKRGYRWLLEVSITQDPSKANPLTISNLSESIEVDEVSSQSLNQDQALSKLKSISILTISSIAIFALLSYLLLWSVNYFNDSSVIKVALLPIKIESPQRRVSSISDHSKTENSGIKVTDQSLRGSARHFEDLLKQQILASESIRFLSSRTMEGHQKNLYPYLSREFSATWIIETRVRSVNNKTQIMVNIVDARTAIVSDSMTFEVTESRRDIENFVDTLLLLL